MLKGGGLRSYLNITPLPPFASYTISFPFFQRNPFLLDLTTELADGRPTQVVLNSLDPHLVHSLKTLPSSTFRYHEAFC